MGRQAKGVRLIRLDSDQKLHNVVAFEGGDDTPAADEESGLVIETRTLPVAESTEEDADDGDDESDGDESDDEEPEDDIEYEEDDADDSDEDEEIDF